MRRYVPWFPIIKGRYKVTFCNIKKIALNMITAFVVFFASGFGKEIEGIKAVRRDPG